MAKIRIHNLSVSYSGSEVLHDVNVEFPEKQLTVIIGPSGCGKTTLLKCLNRLVDLNEDIQVRGKVLVDEVNIYDPGTDLTLLRKKIGFLPQNPIPLPMSIYDNVAFGPRVHRMTRQQILTQLENGEKKILNKMGFDSMSDIKKKEMDVFVEYYLRLAGLWDEVQTRLKSPASKLSIGQQQRLALARTLAVEPEVILADEPTSALDPISAQLIEEQFNILKKNYTFIVVTHTLRQAKRIADYAMFVYLGDLVECGPAKKFFNSPSNKMTRAYIRGDTG